jgi:hypothetical protein
MQRSIYPAILTDDYNVAPIKIRNQLITAGTFSLRRTKYLNEIESGLLLNTELRLALISLIKADDFDAKQKMLARNLRLVANIAMRYVNRGVEFLDLVREVLWDSFMRWGNLKWKEISIFLFTPGGAYAKTIEHVIMTRTCYQPNYNC